MSAIISIDPTALTDAQRDAFVAGWTAAGGYTDDAQGDNPSPWCAPWTHGISTITVSGATPEDWGASWWQACRAGIEQLAYNANA